jgi:DNA-binding response OmpR family regulator
MAVAKKTILVVEDDELIREAVTEGLTQARFNVITAKNGEEGLKMALGKHPDSIVLDLMMPVKNGHEMLAELRQDKWGAKVPVTVLTNATDNVDIFRATQQPNTHYAIKSSMSIDQIVNIVKSRVI